MEKYSMNNLFVIKICNDNNTYYLICTYNESNDTFIDIFTNEEIIIIDKSNIKSLSDYYSSLNQCKDTVNKTQTLDKNDLLRKCITINTKHSLESDKSLSKSGAFEVSGVLEKATFNFFPKDGKWYTHCFEQPQELDMLNLPCHLRDDLWLAKMLKLNQNLIYMNTNRILLFVKNSTFFKEKRHQYEQEIVKWQIYQLINYREKCTIYEVFSIDSPMCDLDFRKSIVDILNKIGMNSEAVEEGIEKNSNMWREQLMLRAFTNEYEPIILNDDNDELLEHVDLEFKEKWLKMRKYEYYQEHKDSVNKYGFVEHDMVLSDDEVVELRNYLWQNHILRKTQLEQYEENKNSNKGKQRLLKNSVGKLFGSFMQ